ncbi:uncharacterized protein [Ptychodera flava]|uniref:uncharacterized protein n=1 Tax=Ptychodera flava TaxID=63121 RepID=UPI00396A2C1F
MSMAFRSSTANVSADRDESTRTETLEDQTSSPKLTADQLFQLELKKLEIEEKRALREWEREEKAAQREHERHMAERTETRFVNLPAQRIDSNIKILPLDEKDDIDVYLRTFEQIARTSMWAEDTWVVRLAPSLTGKAREAYIGLSPDDATNYPKLKEAIYKRYELNAEAYRLKFRTLYPMSQETYTEWGTKLRAISNRWLEIEEVKSLDNLKGVLLNEQIYAMLPKDLCLWIKDKKPASVQEVLGLADDYVTNRGGIKLNSKPETSSYKQGLKFSNQNSYLEPKVGERDNCQDNGNFSGKCFNCGKTGHKSVQCPDKTTRAEAKPVLMCKDSNANGKVQLSPYETFGTINGQKVRILRDTGCTPTIVNKKFVTPESYTGNSVPISGIDRIPREYPLARVFLDCEYFSGWICVAVHSKLGRDILLGNEMGSAWDDYFCAQHTRNIQDTNEALIVTPSREKRPDEQAKQKEQDIKSTRVKSIQIIDDQEIKEEVPLNTHKISSTAVTNCQKTAHAHKGDRAPRNILPTIDAHFSRICMDILGPLPGDESGNG